MGKRVFMVINGNFPRMGAGTNYIQYFALALLEKGWEVIVLGEGDNQEEDKNPYQKGYLYHGIRYDNIGIPDDKIRAAWHHKVLYGKLVAKKLREYAVCADDYLIFYTYSHKGITYATKHMKEVNKDHISVCCVEWFEPDKYKLGKFDPLYWEYMYTFNRAFTITKRVIPISHELDNHFREKGCKTLLLPIMADPYEFPYDEEKNGCNDGKIRLIYPGAATKKDSFDIMIKSILALPENVRNRVEFHVTKMNKKKLKTLLGGEKWLIDYMGSLLVLHDWMSFNDLIKLYREMDFLLLARENRQTTRANFPSKIPELMSFGVIPICSDVGDCPAFYLTDGYDSILFEGCTVENCSEAILKAASLTDDKRREMRNNARKCVIDKFYYRNWAERIDDFLLDR